MIAPLLMMLTGCGEKGQREPHQATLYDICEVAPESGNPAVLYLYQPDGDEPAILTAPGQSLEGTVAGMSVMVAYIPTEGLPYASGNITIQSWAKITNLDLSVPADDEADWLDGWNSDPVYLMSAWRAGGKICMRLKLPYSTQPRRMALLLDPSTADQPIPTAYLYHSRSAYGETFDRQYYLAIDISRLWSLPSTEGLRILVADTNTPSGTATILFSK